MLTRPTLLCLLTSTMFLLFLVFQGIGYGDLDTTSAFKPYQVSFADWVVVYLSTQVSTSAEDYFIQVVAKPINKKIRFVVQGYYTDTPIGLRWYQSVGSKIEELIAKQCKTWTMEGYPISLNDFEITIRKL